MAESCSASPLAPPARVKVGPGRLPERLSCCRKRHSARPAEYRPRRRVETVSPGGARSCPHVCDGWLP